MKVRNFFVTEGARDLLFDPEIESSVAYQLEVRRWLGRIFFYGPGAAFDVVVGDELDVGVGDVGGTWGVERSTYCVLRIA
jgi:hypothetical protein